MRMPTPSCHGHRYIRVPLAPIGSEQRKAPLPGFRFEARWLSSRLLGPLDCRCDRLEQSLLVDVIHQAPWNEDPRQNAYPVRRAKRMLDLPRPERPVSPDGMRGDYPRGRPTPKPAPPGQGNTIPRDPWAPNPQVPESQPRPPSPPATQLRIQQRTTKTKVQKSPGPTGSAGPKLATWSRWIGPRIAPSPDAPVDA